MFNNTDEQIRQSRVACMRDMINHGLSESDAQMVLDIACHAGEQAQQTLNRCIEVLPPHLQILGISLAVTGLSQVLDLARAEIRVLAMAHIFQERDKAENGESI